MQVWWTSKSTGILTPTSDNLKASDHSDLGKTVTLHQATSPLTPNEVLFNPSAILLKPIGNFDRSSAVLFNPSAVLLKPIGNFDRSSAMLFNPSAVLLKPIGDFDRSSAVLFNPSAVLLKPIGDFDRSSAVLLDNKQVSADPQSLCNVSNQTCTQQQASPNGGGRG